MAENMEEMVRGVASKATQFKDSNFKYESLN